MIKSNSKADLKRANARIMKWRQMLDKGLFKDKDLLIKRARKGIPNCLRMKVWPQLTKIEKFIQKQPLTYSKILIKDSLDVYDINLDIPRTFSFESQQILRKSLFNVLKALSIQFPQIGYCQGMNFLVMRMLEIVDDEKSYYLISYIIKKHKQICTKYFNEDDNFRNPGFVTRQNQVFKQLMKKFLPQIYQKLQQDKIQPVMYTPSWFVTLYSKSLSSQKFYRFFDCFLLEGYPVLYKVALALMKFKEKDILNNSMEDNFLFISNMDFYEKIDDDIFIKTMSQFNISEKFILQVQKQYQSFHRNSITKIEKNVEQCYLKKRNNQRPIVQWTFQDFQMANYQIIQFDE